MKLSESGMLTDERCERIFGRLIPNHRHVWPKVKKLIDEFDAATPQTTLAKAEHILGSLTPATPIRQRFLLRLIKTAMRLPGLKESVIKQLDQIIKLTKAEASKDARYALLLKLMHQADRKLPCAGAVVTSRHGDPRQWFEIQMNSLSKINLAKSMTGERRAKAVKDAFRDTVEFLYAPYIKTLVYLSYIREGKNEESLEQVKEMRFGNALRHLSAKLTDHEKLFDRRASWMRNCVTHDYLAYHLQTDVFIFSDAGNNPIAIGTDELLTLTEDMYQLAGETIARVGQLYMFREMFRNMGLREIFINHIPPIALAKTPSEAKALEETMKKELKAKFETGH